MVIPITTGTYGKHTPRQDRRRCRRRLACDWGNGRWQEDLTHAAQLVRTPTAFPSNGAASNRSPVPGMKQPCNTTAPCCRASSAWGSNPLSPCTILPIPSGSTKKAAGRTKRRSNTSPAMSKRPSPPWVISRSVGHHQRTHRVRLQRLYDRRIFLPASQMPELPSGSCAIWSKGMPALIASSISSSRMPWSALPSISAPWRPRAKPFLLIVGSPISLTTVSTTLLRMRLPAVS